ncbi:endonuclease III [Candidatus Micrarchaeota archaeon]|nr:endonuclease III [Candidatus Micrarchaeota archaeon]
MPRSLNTNAYVNLPLILGKMDFVARSRNAPVFRAVALTSSNPFKILVFTMLSARTRDDATIDAVERLFSVAPDPKSILSLSDAQLFSLLHGVGFFRTKASYLREICSYLLLHSFPSTLDKMLLLNGVGRKTANIVLSRVYGTATLGVDVHVQRIANRMGLVQTKKPRETEDILTKKISPGLLSTLNLTLVAFGQTVCKPKNPDCSNCPVFSYCFRRGVKS